MSPIIYWNVLAILVCGVYGRAIDETDNAIGGVRAATFVESNEWIKIKPIKIRPHVGNMVELECDAIGSPPPSIHWVRGGKAIDNVSMTPQILATISSYFIRLSNSHPFSFCKSFVDGFGNEFA